MPEILVINPNCTQAVTLSMDRCLDRVRAVSTFELRCATLESSVPSIDTDEDVSEAVPLLLERIKAEQADAYVIGCFSDPGLAKARAATKSPVVGMGQAAYLTALGMGGRFGILSDLDKSTPRHRRYIEELGLLHGLAADRGIGFSADQQQGPAVYDRLVAVARQLCVEDGADVIILGCAGLGFHRERLEADLQVPVIDPVQAGACLASTLLTLAPKVAR